MKLLRLSLESDTLEGLYQELEKARALLVTVPEAKTGGPTEAKDAPAPAAPQAPAEDGERASIKAELDALGVKYDGKQGTAYLKRLLAKSAKKAPPVEEAEVKSEIDVSAMRGETAPSLDVVRESMMKFAEANGVVKAKELLLKFKVAKISDLTPAQLTELNTSLSAPAASEDMFG